MYFHRGLDTPLSAAPASETVPVADVPLQRMFRGGDERILQEGFIGRRRELHALRKRLKEAGPESRVFVFQGFGGLGKSTLQFQLPALLKIDWPDVCILWCADATARDPVAGLAKQLSDWAEKRFGAAAWVGVIQAVDRAAGEDGLKRFQLFLSVVLEQTKKLLLVADNLESLLTGPDDITTPEPDPHAFGEWNPPVVRTWWQYVRGHAERTGTLWLTASTRYQHPDYADVQLAVSDLPPDAVFRLMRWHSDLRKLHVATRARLVQMLAGHPCAVQYLNDLIRAQLVSWKKRKGEWKLPSPPTKADLEKEWNEIVAPVIPEYQKKLVENLLLRELWDKVFDDKMRRMLYRMTLLRRPWEWDLVPVLGESDESPEAAEKTADEIARTSLLLREDYPNAGPQFCLHPTTKEFVLSRFPDDEVLRLDTHRRVGTNLETATKTSRFIAVDLEAGYHLFQAGEYDRSYDLLGSASDWLQNRGQVVQGLAILEPFLPDQVRRQLSQDRVGRLLGTVGVAYARLGRVEEAIDYLKQQLVIAREIGDRQGEGNALGNLGSAYAALGRVEEAIGYHQQALVISREIGDRQSEGNALGNLGTAYFRLGRVEEAIDYLKQQLVIAREIGDRQGEGNALGNLGIAYAALGRVEEAIGYYQQRLVIAREIGDRRGEGNALGNLGSAYAALGRVEEAIGYHQQALVISREIGDRQGEGSELGNLGSAYLRLGRMKEAIEHLQQRLAIAREIGDRQGESNARGNLGLVYLNLDRVEEAISYYQQQLVIVREIGDRQGEGNALGNLGVAYARLGRVEEAIGYYQQQLAIAREIGDRRGEGIVLANLGEEYSRLGRMEQAIELLEQALAIGREIKVPQIVGFALQQLAKLRGELPPEQK